MGVTQRELAVTLERKIVVERGRGRGQICCGLESQWEVRRWCWPVWTTPCKNVAIGGERDPVVAGA